MEPGAGRHGVRPLVLSLALAAVFLAALLSPFGFFAAESSHTDETVAIDTNIAGNSATAVGTIDTCRRVDVGAVFDVDVVMLNAHDLGCSPGLHLDRTSLNCC